MSESGRPSPPGSPSRKIAGESIPWDNQTRPTRSFVWKDSSMSRSLRTDRAEMERWAEELAKSPVREQPPTTVSGRPIEPLYTPNDLNGCGGESDDRYPGQYPFMRGIHASMYRGRLWTMRQ